MAASTHKGQGSQGIRILAVFLGIQAGIATVIVATTAILAVLFFPEIVGRHLWFAVLSVAVWGVAVSAGFHLLLVRNRTVRKGLLLEAPPYPGDPEEITRSFSLIAGMDQLLGNQVRKIGLLADADRVAFLVGGAGGDDYRIRASRGYGEEDTRSSAVRGDAPLARWLRINETHLIPRDSTGVMEGLNPEERDLLDRLRVTVVFPLVALNRLVGMIFVSRDEGIGESQVEAISWLIPHLSLAMANSMMAEQQRIRMSRLYRAERLATTGQLAAGAAHEIRNPLASIRSAIQFLKDRPNADPETSEMMGDLLKEADRIDSIVQGMLSFARPPEPRLERIDLKEAVSQVLKLLEPTIRKGRVETAVRFPEEPAEVEADPNQLRQVFLNLMLNAVQAMPDGGILEIRVSRDTPLPGRFRWQAEIADTGSGIAPGDREKIFDPFYTTKRDGTGLGLSICHSILQRHGGEIEVESESGRGTKVRIRL